jgi:hypothetical protein
MSMDKESNISAPGGSMIPKCAHNFADNNNTNMSEAMKGNRMLGTLGIAHLLCPQACEGRVLIYGAMQR